MKKIIASILFICILVTSMTVTGFAAYENTHKQTGNQADDLIAVAQTQLGYREGANANDLSGNTSFRGDGNYTKYGAWYGINPGGDGVQCLFHGVQIRQAYQHQLFQNTLMLMLQ